MKDIFNLPAALAEENGTPPTVKNTANQNNPNSFSVSVSDIKNFISPKLYGELSWDEKRTADDVTQECIDKALTLAEVLLLMVEEKLNLFSKTQQEIVKLLTVSKLYEYNGDKTGTKEFLEKAEALISDRYRSLEKVREAVQPFISVSKPKKKKGRTYFDFANSV